MLRMAISGAETSESVQNDEDFTSQKPLSGESPLWYNRYLLYRNMGTKRSLRAAVEAERARIHAVKEPEKATKNAQKGVKRQITSAFPSVPTPPSVVHVPGSWKNAARVYHWRERCQTYELSVREALARRTEEELAATYGNRYRRIKMLDQLIKNASDVLKAFMASEKRSVDHYISYVKLLQGLLAQMERETASSPELTASIEAWCATRKEMIDQYIAGEAENSGRNTLF